MLCNRKRMALMYVRANLLSRLILFTLPWERYASYNNTSLTLNNGRRLGACQWMATVHMYSRTLPHWNLMVGVVGA